MVQISKEGQAELTARLHSGARNPITHHKAVAA